MMCPYERDIMSTDQVNNDNQSILGGIDPQRIAAIRAPGLELQTHSDRDAIAREKWEEQKKSAAVGSRMMNFIPPGTR